ncbi:class I SAM-dependent methyltransferase [Cupriavidus necator]|uniref:class I SAM-dependent methyltransferase n=1 Tax=Cupriavidus necator TaxID=106590 RepID=UPI00277D9D1E|nr:class I SAM-dependent methyltransferase [Cupriavidus necator]MDQ0139821.1 SAM-dependent methyltransferase [Cupriavidus necator]
MNAVHQAAAQGFASQADTYARGRPEYPAEIDAWLRGALGLHAGRAVLDLGAGTGKFTRWLVQTGAAVTAVEPVAQMRAQLAAAVAPAQALEGSAEAIPLADASVDAVVCAQAFHWFANAQALAEIRRVLRPDGRLGLVWNVRDESVDWVAQLTAIMAPYEGDAPRFHKGDWKRCFPAGGFGPLALHSLPYTHVGPPQRVIIDRVMSVSFIASLPLPEQARVRARLLALIDQHPDLSGRAEVAFPYRTEAYHCERLA